MSIISIIVPLMGFAAAILWMIREGTKAKKDYQRRKDEEEKKARAVANEDRLLKELGSSYRDVTREKPPTPIEKALRGSDQSGHFQKPGQA